MGHSTATHVHQTALHRKTDGRSSSRGRHGARLHGIQAKLNAEHQVNARDRNDKTTKKTKTTITETIDFEERDDREVIDDGYEF